MNHHKHRKTYKGLGMKQADGIELVFENFFQNEYFDRVIELGTGAGGFSLVLAELMKDKVYTFDIKDKLTKDAKNLLLSFGVSLFVEDIFNSKTVIDLIQKEGRILLLCDNGNKIKEVNTFKNFLKKSDIIMAHDYFKKKEDFYLQNSWTACEITSDDIEKDDSLTSYKEDIFNSFFWMCKIKL